MMKVVIIGLLACLFSLKITAQITPQKVMTPAFIAENTNDTSFTDKKTDPIFKQQIEGALLFYPELKNAKITFKVKKTLVPLAARPRIWAVFQKPRNRKYLIIISSKTIPKLEPILLKNLSFNAQVGVLGHEISHIADFHKQKSGYFIKLLFMQVRKKAMDIFENDTDRRTIEHGLGYQLLSWSTEVRQNLKIKEWGGAETKGLKERERYMSPKTIEQLIDYKL